MTLRREKCLVSGTLLAFVLAVFTGVKSLERFRVMSSWCSLPIDSRVPFVPTAIWIYLSWYLSPLVILASSQRQFRRGAAAVTLAFILCATLWVSFPTEMHRPHLASPDTLSIVALSALYAVDPPSNLFPSFHAALGAVLLTLPMPNRRKRWLLRIWVLAISLSCILTKQHYALDIASGLAVGYLAVIAVDYATTGTIKAGPAYVDLDGHLSITSRVN